MNRKVVIVKPNSPKAQKRWIRRGLIAALVLAAAFFGAALAYFVTRQISLGWSGSGGLIGPSLVETSSGPAFNAEGTPLPPGADASMLPGATLTPWDGAGRVTVLLLGLDYRDWENQEDASRSDTMILLTLDPQAKTAGILSIPRDLWVAIPGFKHAKINTAYYNGDAYKLPGGGPALAVKTVEQFLGVPINYYAQIDFSAFVRFIDEIGGVEIDVPYEIKIDLLGSGAKTKKKLQPGRQVLPGEWALAYARNRYTENGDFDRAERQQQVIMAIRDRILSFDMLPTLIQKAPTLYSELAGGIRTNLQLDEVVRLALLAQEAPEENIQRGLINKDNVYFGESPDGLSILIPIPDDIHELRDRIFASSGSIGPQTPGDALAKVKVEGARVAIYNGSGVPGLAERAANQLRAQGVNVVQAVDGESYSSSVVVDHSGAPYALSYLVDFLKIGQGNIRVEFQLDGASDLDLYLGADAANANIFP